MVRCLCTWMFRDLEGLTGEAVTDDHQKDLEIQDEYGGKYHSTGTTKRRARSFAHAKLLAKKRRRPFTEKPIGS
jgi:hypothetical protein